MHRTKLRRIISGSFIAAAVITLCALSFVFQGDNKEPSESIPSILSDSDGDASDGSFDENAPAKETVRKKFVRITSSTYLLEKGSFKAERISLLSADSEYEYLDETDDFYKVSFESNQTGWVKKDKCELIDKAVVVKHIPQKPSDLPYSMSDTVEGESLDEIMAKHDTVGASVAIIKDGKVAYHYEYGYANKEDKNNPVTINENTKYRVASISKVFTSMLAMAEAEDGKLDLDAGLSDLFGYKFYNPKYPDSPVTMRMLLTHTAGLSTEEGLYSEDLTSVARGEEYYRSRPGSSFAYSNLGMGIAGAAVEKAADKTISQYAKERFFDPMGIDASYEGSMLSDPSLVADCYNNGHLKRTNKVLTRPINRKKRKPGDIYYLGQGNLMISAIDLAKVSTILLNDGMYEGRQYLRKETVEQILTVHPVNTRTKYQQCIGIRKYSGLIGSRDMYYHTGTYYGVLAVMVIDPSDKSGVIVITSGAHPGRDDNTVFTVCNDVLNYCYDNII